MKFRGSPTVIPRCLPRSGGPATAGIAGVYCSVRTVAVTAGASYATSAGVQYAMA